MALTASTVVVNAGVASAAAPKGPSVGWPQASSRHGLPVTVDLLAGAVPGDAPIDPSTLKVYVGDGVLPTAHQDSFYGIVALGPGPGDITYTPGLYNGLVNLGYAVSDTNGVASTGGYVTINVLAGLYATAYNGTTAQSIPLAINLNSLSRGGEFPVVTLLDSTGQPVNTMSTPQGTYNLDQTAYAIIFTPVPSFTGVASPVQFMVTDISAQTAQSTITITVTAGTQPPPTTTPPPPTTQPAPTTTPPPPPTTQPAPTPNPAPTTSPPAPPTNTTPARPTRPHRPVGFTRWGFASLFDRILQDLERALHKRFGTP